MDVHAVSNLARTCAVAVCVLGAWLAAGIPVQGGTIGIAYSFAGALIGPPVISGGVLTVNGTATGSFDQSNAAWNPVTFDTVDHVDLATGSNSGSFTMTFANGETLSGALSEGDSMVNTVTATGPFTQTLTFTAGTGEFAGVTGFSSGGGSVIATVFTETGSGDLTAPGLIGPEPGSIVLVFGGGAFLALRLRWLRAKQLRPLESGDE